MARRYPPGGKIPRQTSDTTRIENAVRNYLDLHNNIIDKDIAGITISNFDGRKGEVLATADTLEGKKLYSFLAFVGKKRVTLKFKGSKQD